MGRLHIDRSQAAWDVPLPDKGVYIGNHYATGYSSGPGNARLAFKSSLHQFPAGFICDRVSLYVTTAGTVGAGSDNSSMRMYPVDGNRQAIKGAKPLRSVSGVSLLITGAWAHYDLAVPLLMPRFVIVGGIHDYGSAPTVETLQATSGIRSLPQSVENGLPTTTFNQYHSFTWTEAVFGSDATKTWNNPGAASLLTNNSYAFKFRRKT